MNSKLISGIDLSNSVYDQLRDRIKNFKADSIVPSK